LYANAPAGFIGTLGLLQTVTGSGTLYQNISVCPGANYELTFTMAMDHDTYAGDFPVTFSALVFNNVLFSTTLTATSSALNGYGPYPFTVPESTDTFTFTDLQFTFSATTEVIIFAGAALIFYLDDVSVYQP
jgi:hypothetical protein